MIKKAYLINLWLKIIKQKPILFVFLLVIFPMYAIIFVQAILLIIADSMRCNEVFECIIFWRVY